MRRGSRRGYDPKGVGRNRSRLYAIFSMTFVLPLVWLLLRWSSNPGSHLILLVVSLR